MSTVKWIGIVTLCGAVTLWAAGPVPGIAGEGKHGGEGHHGAGGGEAPRPETVAGIWHAIDEQVAHLDETIAAGKLADVHKVAFAIRDLAKELPEKSTDLPEAKQKLLTGLVERVAEHATNLDTYGDGGKAKETAAEFTQLKKRLDYMRGLYPAADIGDAHEEDAHHQHE